MKSPYGENAMPEENPGFKGEAEFGVVDLEDED